MSDDSIRDRLEQQAQKAMIQNAFFRWESAVMIAGTILLSVFFAHPFAAWPLWGWPALGLIGEIAIVVSSLTDKSEQQRVVESLFREQYNTGGIRDRDLRAKLAEAEQYQERIQQLVLQQRGGILRDRMADTTTQVYDWIGGMVKLARRIDAYRSDDILKRDMQITPKEIKDLSARLNLETNPQVKEQIQTTLASKKQLAGNLAELTSRMDRADLQLDHSLAALGTVYSQMLLIGSSDVDSGRADRLREDIRNEVNALQDLVQSINEVYNYDAGTVSSESAGQADTVRRQQMAGRR